MYQTMSEDERETSKKAYREFSDKFLSKKDDQESSSDIATEITDINIMNDGEVCYGATSETQKARKAHDLLRQKFVSMAGEEKLKKYVERWCIGVNGFCIGTNFYEFTALQDFFTALKLGRENIVERAIEIGQNNNGICA